jgi:hypothetical protein
VVANNAARVATLSQPVWCLRPMTGTVLTYTTSRLVRLRAVCQPDHGDQQCETPPDRA